MRARSHVVELVAAGLAALAGGCGQPGPAAAPAVPAPRAARSAGPALGTCVAGCAALPGPSPLAPHAGAIARCYDAAPRGVVARLAVGIEDGAARVTTHTEAAAVAACVDRALDGIAFDTAGRAVTCTVAPARTDDVAPRPVGARVEVTGRGIAVEGQLVVTAADLAGPDGQAIARREIDRRMAIIDTGGDDGDDGDGDEDEDDRGEDLRRRRWVALRAEPQVPAGAVLVAARALPADELAIQHARAIGTTDAWAALTPRGAGAWPGCPDLERAVTVAVSAGALAVARSGEPAGAAPRVIPLSADGPAATAALDDAAEAGLRDALAGARRALPHRTDLMVVADTGVAFRPIAQVLDIADRAGFWDVELAGPAATPAR